MKIFRYKKNKKLYTLGYCYGKRTGRVLNAQPYNHSDNIKYGRNRYQLIKIEDFELVGFR